MQESTHYRKLPEMIRDGAVALRAVGEYRVVYGFAVKLMGNHQDAGDAVQTVYARLCEHYGTNPANELNANSLRIYLCRGVINLRLDARKSSARRREIPLEEVDSGNLTQEQFSPIEQVIRNEDLGRVRRALGSLDELHRTLLRLRAENLTLEEISEATGIPASTVQFKIKKGLGMLKVAYGAV